MNERLCLWMVQVLSVSMRVCKHFMKLLMPFKEVHKSVQLLLSEEEKEEGHVEWYEPRITNFRYWLKEIE